MDLHEESAKTLLQRCGVPSPPFISLSYSEKEAGAVDREIEEALIKLGVSEAVVKAQILAGGRGKAGGIRFAKSREEVFLHTKELLGSYLSTAQTSQGGVQVKKVLLTPFVAIEKEMYLALLIDRSKKEVILLGTSEGGMDVEEVARKSPEKIFRITIPSGRLPMTFELIPFIKGIGIEPALFREAISLLQSCTKAFHAYDLTLLEINPLVLTKKGELLALDAKMSIDDNSLFRQKELECFFDTSRLSPLEKRAEKAELSYVAMEGTIGCMVNGAGLAMATMDIISFYGKKAANFLDVGGSASKEKIAEGFRILLSDPCVKGVLVNIFGGIMSCETIADAMIEVAKEENIQLPMVIRMEGNHVETARDKLSASKLPFIVARSLEDAAQKVAQKVE